MDLRWALPQISSIVSNFYIKLPYFVFLEEII